MHIGKICLDLYRTAEPDTTPSSTPDVLLSNTSLSHFSTPSSTLIIVDLLKSIRDLLAISLPVRFTFTSLVLTGILSNTNKNKLHGFF